MIPTALRDLPGPLPRSGGGSQVLRAHEVRKRCHGVILAQMQDIGMAPFISLKAFGLIDGPSPLVLPVHLVANRVSRAEVQRSQS